MKIIYYRESAFQSIVADTYTFGVIAVMLWLNVRHFGDHAIVAGIIVIAGFVFALGKGATKAITFTDKFRREDDRVRYERTAAWLKQHGVQGS